MLLKIKLAEKLSCTSLAEKVYILEEMFDVFFDVTDKRWLSSFP